MIKANDIVIWKDVIDCIYEPMFIYDYNIVEVYKKEETREVT